MVVDELEPREGPCGRGTLVHRSLPSIPPRRAARPAATAALRSAVLGVVAVLALASCTDGSSDAQRTGDHLSRGSSTRGTALPEPATAPPGPAAAVTATPGEPALATTTTVPSPPTTPPGPPPLADEPGDLAAGVRGLRTQALQRRLNDLRFDVGEPDGSFGANTEAAVWAWQALNGLPADGVVNRATFDVIMASAPSGMLHPELGPTHVEVDLDRQVMLVFRDGQLDLVTHVSSGSNVPYCEVDPRDGSTNCGDAQTPPGTFAFGRRAAGWEIGPLGGLYNPIYFNGGIAVHGAESVPAHPASHGCVRIPMHIAEYLPAKIDTGETVIVFNGGSGVVPPAGVLPPEAPPTAPTPVPDPATLPPAPPSEFG